jgi:hypothetical protein
MHAEADQWVSRYGSTQPLQVLEIGSLNINGTARVHWPNARWLGIDRQRGLGVDVVCDFLDWDSDSAWDVVVCCEVLEHANDWRDIVGRVKPLLMAGGIFVGTCAGPLRTPHSAIDGGLLRQGEYYGNLTADDLLSELQAAGFLRVLVHDTGHDLRWWAACG